MVEVVSHGKSQVSSLVSSQSNENLKAFFVAPKPVINIVNKW